MRKTFQTGAGVARQSPAETVARFSENAATEFQRQSSGTGYLQIPIRYLQTSPIRVKGPITGRNYEFSARHPVQLVDNHDATALLRTGFFRRD